MSSRIKYTRHPTFEVDIAQEFHDVKRNISDLTSEINSWKSGVIEQLTTLNQNMKNVLDKLAEHEARITLLEQARIENETKIETATETTRFWIPWVGFAFKVAFAAASALGAAELAKVIGLF